MAEHDLVTWPIILCLVTHCVEGALKLEVIKDHLVADAAVGVIVIKSSTELGVGPSPLHLKRRLVQLLIGPRVRVTLEAAIATAGAAGELGCTR